MEKDKSDFRMVATTMFGLEEILAAELLKLGARDIEKFNRAVSFTGDNGFMYKANFCLRTALRVLKPIANFQADDSNHLYKQVKKIDWEKYLSENGTLAVDAAVNSDTFTHSQFVSQRVKDAVCDRFREIANDVRPSVDLDFPDVRINIHIVKNTCTISLDSSGYSLHKRGYRDSTGIAPMNEVLAAGLVLLSGWSKTKTLVDPMCGSGTIAFEAAMMAANIPPGYYREKFGFEKWKDFDAELFETIREKIIDKITDYPAQVFASDLSPNNIKKAKQNSKFAKVDDMVKFTVSDFLTLEKPAPTGVIIMNPPYGERMDKDDLVNLYKQIGDRLKKHWTGYEAWIISSNVEAINKIGLRHSRRISLFNGKLECKYLKYEMYEGAKKDKYKTND